MCVMPSDEIEHLGEMLVIIERRQRLLATFCNPMSLVDSGIGGQQSIP